MRWVALTVANAVLLCALATATPASAAKVVVLKLNKSDAHHTRTYPRSPGPWIHGQTMGYWGKFTSLGTEGGSYRATCVWLANTKWPNVPKQDNRLSCTIVIAFRDAFALGKNHDASGMVLQGLVKRPVGSQQLFEQGSMRKLVVTGGTGSYTTLIESPMYHCCAGAYGYADVRYPWTILVTYGLQQLV